VVDSVVHGDGADVAVLWGAACAEFAMPGQTKNDMLDLVRQRVNSAIRERYAAVAVNNFQTIGARFDDAAKGFTAAASAVDPTTPAEIVVAGSDKIRQAWQASATHAAELSKLLPVLKAAAELAGLCGPDHDDALDLCVDGTGIEREQLLDAWRTEEAEALAARQHANSPFSRATPTFTRGGRWTALVTVGGAIIRARQPAMATATT
jgi:hypothetical protein